ncbi:hypothetical protein ACFDTO_15590 [Microbacteriaceae bacterium 4G12]
MNIFLCGSNDLTALDGQEIYNYLSRYAPKHNIHLLCYKSIENEVLRFFVENEELASHLHVYTLQPLHELSHVFRDIMEYLDAQGNNYSSFNYSSTKIYRSRYIDFLKQIFQNIDLVLCFYNGNNHTAVIPVDVAKECKIDALIYDLPGDNKDLARQSLKNKMRVIE